MKEVANKESICFVIPHFVTFSTGGAEIQVHYLTQAFLKRGWKVEVVCAGIGYEEKIKSSPFYNQQIQYHYYKKRNIRILEYLDVLKVLKQTNSYYYYQRTDFALTAATYKFSKRRNRKMVYSLAADSDTQLRKYSEAFKNFEYSGILKKAIRKADFYLLDKVIENAKRNVKYVVCQNIYQQESYLKNFDQKSIIISNSFLSDEEYKLEKQKIILWCANNNPVKRPKLFVELAQSFEKINEWKFVMLGSACDMITNKELPSNIKVLGSVSYQEANKWFSKSSIYINTSSDEGMPNTFIQSWYFKTLVLSLAVDPNGVFSKEKAGFCFNDDLSKLKLKLESLVKEGKEIDSLENGATYFNTHFNLDMNVEKLIEFITA